MRLRTVLLGLWNLGLLVLAIWLIRRFWPLVVGQFEAYTETDNSIDLATLGVAYQGVGLIVGWPTVLLSLTSCMSGRVGLYGRSLLALPAVIALALVLYGSWLQLAWHIEIGWSWLERKFVVFMVIVVLSTVPAIVTGRGLLGWPGRLWQRCRMGEKRGKAREEAEEKREE